MVWCMLKAKKLPDYFWGEAVTTAVHVLNRASMRAFDDMTPYEAWHSEHPPFHYLRIFGCIRHVKNMWPHQMKLDDHSSLMIFIGYESGSKAWRFYDPNTGHVTVSRDVIFDEAGQWKWNEHDANTSINFEPFTIEFTTLYTPGVPEVEEMEQGTSTPRTHSLAPTPTSPILGSLVTFISPPLGHLEDLDADHEDNVPLRFRTLDSVLSPASPPGLAARLLDEELHFSSAEVPASLREAEKEACWRGAMLEEMKSITDNNTWDLVELPRGHHAIGLKWVYKVKRDENGDIMRH